MGVLSVVAKLEPNTRKTIIADMPPVHTSQDSVHLLCGGVDNWKEVSFNLKGLRPVSPCVSDDSEWGSKGTTEPAWVQSEKDPMVCQSKDMINTQVFTITC